MFLKREFFGFFLALRDFFAAPVKVQVTIGCFASAELLRARLCGMPSASAISQVQAMLERERYWL